nr:restriction endonuclease subunit S [uncultured Albidiferax sp.]
MLLSNLDVLATAPGGVARLRELILTLAVQGKLVPQDPSDEPASKLLTKIRAEKDRLIAEGKIKRDKPLEEIGEEEKPFGLPNGWEWERFGTIAGIERGGSPRPIQSFLTNDPDGLNWIKIGDTEKGGKYITAASEKIRRDGLSKTRMVFPGDFLLTNSMSFGRPYITQIEGCIHDGWLRISPPISLNKDFLYVLLSSRFIRTVFEAAAAGGVVLNLNADKVRTVPIPLPPLVEQSRIVTRVEELMRLCDALEAKGRLEAAQHAQLVSTLLGTLLDSPTPTILAENWQRIATHFDLLLDRPQAVDALEQTILQLAVRGLLVPQDPTDEPASKLLQKIRAEKDKLIAGGKIKRDKPLPVIAADEQPPMLPVGWECVRFGDYFFELCTGPFGSVIHKEDYVDGGVPLINPSHMIGGRISHDPAVSVSLTMAEQLGAYRLAKGDVLLARRGEVGRYALVTEDEDGWLCGTGSFFVKLHEVSNREFLGLILEDPDLRLHLLGESVGSTMTNLNQRILIETPISLPPLSEQSRIVTRVASLRRLCTDLRQRLSASQSTQAHLAEALVQEVA